MDTVWHVLYLVGCGVLGSAIGMCSVKAYYWMKERRRGNREAGERNPYRAYPESVQTADTDSASATGTGEDMTDAAPEPEVEIPVFVEPVVGYRGWIVRRRGTLESQFSSNYSPSYAVAHSWPARKSSKCSCGARTYGDMKHSHLYSLPPMVPVHNEPAPHLTCNCGFHAAADESGAYYMTDEQGIAAVGTVKLWGRVVEHEGGWRGENAYPEQITIIAPDPVQAPPWADSTEKVELVAQRVRLFYDIPVEVMSFDAWLDRKAELFALEKSVSEESS